MMHFPETRCLLKEGNTILEKAGVPFAEREAKDLLAYALKISPLDLSLSLDQPISREAANLYRDYLKRREKREPFAYITGEVEFLGCRLNVTKDVLIPRQETEILAHRIACDLVNDPLKGKTLLDVGCGSGCLAISLKRRFPELRVVAIDISAMALDVAKKNAGNCNVTIEFLHGDMLAPFIPQKADFIILNPPYLSEKEWEQAEEEVKIYEPKTALASGETGFECYEKFLLRLKEAIVPGGKVFGEMGFLQKEGLLERFLNVPEIKTAVFEKDWAGHDRFFFLEIQSSFT